MTVAAKPKGEGKFEQKSLDKRMLKAILKMHQTTREVTSTMWDTLLVKASSPEADNMQKQTQTYAEKVRQEGRGHTRGPPSVWGVPGSGQVSSAERHGSGITNGPGNSELLGSTGTSLASRNMRRGAILQAGQNIQSRRQENHVEHRVTRETITRSRSTQSNRGRAQARTSSAHSHGTRTTNVSGRSSGDVKIMVRAFLAKKGVQANSKAWHNAMQSEHIQRMTIAHSLAKRT